MQSFDIVVNNAGIGSSERHSLDTELDEFIRIINVEQHRRHLSLRKRP
jgi:short-subunit dehydrogenase